MWFDHPLFQHSNGSLLMMTSSNGNIFRVTALCAGNSSVTGEFPTQRLVMRSFDVFFDLRLNKWLSKQSWGWWFETPSRPLWRHSNVILIKIHRTSRLLRDYFEIWIRFILMKYGKFGIIFLMFHQSISHELWTVWRFVFIVRYRSSLPKWCHGKMLKIMVVMSVFWNNKLCVKYLFVVYFTS